MKTIKILLIVVCTTLTVGLFAQTKGGRVDTSKHTVYYTCSMHDNIAMKQPGNCPICGMKLNLSTKEKNKLGYSCPMHPDVKSDKDGKCPKCGMQLKKVNK